jgi:hypothetical protein
VCPRRQLAEEGLGDRRRALIAMRRHRRSPPPSIKVISTSSRWFLPRRR